MAASVRLAVAGAGSFGREHVRIAARHDDIAVVGVADVSASAAKDAADRFGIAEWATDASELVERTQPDGLIVATPAITHVPIASMALARGIPVLLEKPVAPDTTAGALLASAAAQSRAFVMPGHVLRFSEPHRRLAELAGSVGPILSVTARRHRDDSHATRYTDDPVLMTMIHDIDLCHWITGARVRDLVAARRPAGQRSETSMMANDDRGAVWHLTTAWVFPAGSCPPDRIEVIGERGSVELEVDGAIHVYGAEPQQIDVSGSDPDQPLAAEQAYFAACIRSGRTPTVVTLAEALAGLATAEAVLAALRTPFPASRTGAG